MYTKSMTASETVDHISVYVCADGAFEKSSRRPNHHLAIITVGVLVAVLLSAFGTFPFYSLPVTSRICCPPCYAMSLSTCCSRLAKLQELQCISGRMCLGGLCCLSPVLCGTPSHGLSMKILFAGSLLVLSICKVHAYHAGFVPCPGLTCCLFAQVAVCSCRSGILCWPGHSPHVACGCTQLLEFISFFFLGPSRLGQALGWKRAGW